MLRLLLRPLRSFAAPPAGHARPGPATAALLGRGERMAGAPGWRAQLQRAFDLLPAGELPVAALTRSIDCNDAPLHHWLRADPAHVRADMATVRMLGCGDLGLDAGECEQLLRPLRPVFGDSGCPISAPCPQRWYLALAPDSRLPAFADPHEAMGAPLDEYLPAGELGRRWRHLLNEAQVILHNHPLNAERLRQGKPPVNSLWFWGAGALPDHARTAFQRVVTDDVLLRALAGRAGADVLPPSEPVSFSLIAGTPAATLVDLRDLRDGGALERDWLAPALAGGHDNLQLDFGDGTGIHWRRNHRWRVWRRVARDFA